ncbi:MAG: HD domain-containing protein [Verrucomicrobiota bacterium]
MEASGFRQALVDHLRLHARPPEKYSHQPRLYRLTGRVGEGMIYDDDVVFAAAWLHDLGVFVGHRPEDPVALAGWDHLAYALRETPAVLAGIGFPPAKVPAVLEAIRTHLPAGDPTTLEGLILRDADLLEQLGAVGVLRTVCKVGRDTRFTVLADAVRSLRRAADDLPGRLRLESARRLAIPRVAVLRAFLAAAEEEGGGDL